MKDFFWECKTRARFGQGALPTTLRELGFRDKERAMLPEIAGSCFVSQGAFRVLTSSEILDIYEECF